MYPKVKYLAQAYFHQDFDLEADSPTGVVSLFREREAPEMVSSLSDEINSILSKEVDESFLARIWLEEDGACYDPRQDGIPIRDWLLRVAEILGNR
jgi:hypothetical protein